MVFGDVATDPGAHRPTFAMPGRSPSAWRASARTSYCMIYPVAQLTAESRGLPADLILANHIYAGACDPGVEALRRGPVTRSWASSICTPGLHAERNADVSSAVGDLPCAT